MTQQLAVLLLACLALCGVLGAMILAPIRQAVSGFILGLVLGPAGIGIAIVIRVGERVLSDVLTRTLAAHRVAEQQMRETRWQPQAEAVQRGTGPKETR